MYVVCCPYLSLPGLPMPNTYYVASTHATNNLSCSRLSTHSVLGERHPNITRYGGTTINTTATLYIHDVVQKTEYKV